MDKLLVLTLTALIVLPGPVLANDGDLDGTFGVGGIVSSGFSRFTNATAIQSDGKIVVAGLTGQGASADFALVRYNFDGSLDPTFGSRGQVTTDFGGHGDFARALAIQSDGRIVAAGLAQDIYGTDGFALARYNGDGSLDPTFGIGGKITTALPDSLINALAIQFDGKIVAAGTIDNTNRSVTGSLGAIVRYNSDGSLDAAFGIEGKVTTKVPDFSTYVNALAIQADGKIIAAGRVSSNRSLALLARYNTDGSPDKTFGDGGRVTTDKSYIQGVALQSDGKIIAAGGFPEFGVARYNADGSLDITFGAGGKAVTELWDDFTNVPYGMHDDYLFALSLQSDGKIIAAGESVLVGANLFALARFNRDGSLDATFGSGGKVLSGFGGRGSRITSLGIQRDGKIVAAGFGTTTLDHSSELARFKVDGLLLVYDVHFDSAPTISIGDSWTATLSGSNLTDETYFDLRFRSPGSDTDRVALNWQQGTAARHSIPVGTATGTWIITGVRPHLDISDHGGEFIPVSAALAVSGE